MRDVLTIYGIRVPEYARPAATAHDVSCFNAVTHAVARDRWIVALKVAGMIEDADWIEAWFKDDNHDGKRRYVEMAIRYDYS